MKNIKSFRLFEGKWIARGVKLENNFDGMLELYDDIKSIEYILEEMGYDVIYKFLFKERKNDRYYNYLDENNVRSFMQDNNTHIGKFIGINIEVAYPKDQVKVYAGGQILLTPGQIEKLGSDCERYCNMLKDHLDYVSSVKRFSSDTGKNVIVVKL